MTEPEIDIRPLLEFKRLEYLDICINRLHVAITHQLIEAFGIHWPAIRHLNLTVSGVTCAYPIDSAPPPIDHASLVWLLNACPKLTHLGLRFDARKIGMDPEQDDDIIACAGLHNLDTPAHGISPKGEDLVAGARLHNLNTPDRASSPVSSEDTDEDEDEDLAQPFPNLKTLNIVPPSCELEYFAVAWDHTCDDGEVERRSSRRTKRWAKVAACLASWAATGEIEYVSDDD
ncbi:hypothetical protein FA13DRAFT_1790781 [Coprinellus micaceus]|uniref:Uncharacterized protein n=1 Tax=Coprinellus micaceus TaxID=71717 RepID=A0A4Y7TE75_COPMI|nr:hypothetical protein FA13DRAFT_1790781 [Coprinellus micaceus]